MQVLSQQQPVLVMQLPATLAAAPAGQRPARQPAGKVNGQSAHNRHVKEAHANLSDAAKGALNAHQQNVLAQGVNGVKHSIRSAAYLKPADRKDATKQVQATAKAGIAHAEVTAAADRELLTVTLRGQGIVSRLAI